MITYKVDDWIENLPQFKAIATQHYDEVETLKDFGFDLDYETYKSIYDSLSLIHI